MTSKATVEEFVNQEKLAIVGVSRSGQKFGNGAVRELKAKGYKMFIIHPEAETLEGEPVYKDFASLPEKVGGVVVCVKPEQTEKVVREAAAAGITRVWMQQGSQSDTAIQFCKDNNISEVHGECIMMYGVSTGMHNFHRKINKFFGLAPK